MRWAAVFSMFLAFPAISCTDRDRVTRVVVVEGTEGAQGSARTGPGEQPGARRTAENAGGAGIESQAARGTSRGDTDRGGALADRGEGGEDEEPVTDESAIRIAEGDVDFDALEGGSGGGFENTFAGGAGNVGPGVDQSDQIFDDRRGNIANQSAATDVDTEPVRVRPENGARQVDEPTVPRPGQSEPRRTSRPQERAFAQREADRLPEGRALPPSEAAREDFPTGERDDLGAIGADDRRAGTEQDLDRSRQMTLDDRRAGDRRLDRVGDINARDMPTAARENARDLSAQNRPAQQGADNRAGAGAGTQRSALAPGDTATLVPGAPLASPANPRGSMTAREAAGAPAVTPGAAAPSPAFNTPGVGGAGSVMAGGGGVAAGGGVASGGVATGGVGLSAGAGFPGQGPVGGAPIAGAQNPVAPGGVTYNSALTPRGASTVAGMVTVSRSGRDPQLVVSLTGAGRGVYSVSVREEGCPATIPSEMLTGDADTEDRSVDETIRLQGQTLGQIRVDDDGEATLTAPLSRKGIKGDVVAVMIREEEEANPPLGDKYGLVGCGLVKLPPKDDRG